MSASTEFAMSLPFLGYKQRNAALDTVFYDTKRLSLEERAKLDMFDFEKLGAVGGGLAGFSFGFKKREGTPVALLH